jgi:predicted DNA-binding transcriptional regulator YafY
VQRINRRLRTATLVPDEPALRRQWILLKTLSNRHQGLTVREMAADLGVNQKTIRRDLDLFRGLGFPLEDAVGEFGRKTWRIKGGGNQPPLSFSFDEAVALHLGRRLLEPLAGTLFWDAARRASQKVQASLGRVALDYLDRFSGFFHHTAFGTHDYSKRAELIDTLQLAIEDGKAVRILYRSERAAGPAGRDVSPYGLIYHRGALYLIALAAGEGKVKHFKLDRIEAAEVSTSPSVRPEGFDLATHLGSTLGVYQSDGEVITVRVWFDRAAARYVQESRWHESLRLTEQADGSVLAEFRLSSTEEIKRWVLGFGARAVVLEPERLRREITYELQTIAAAYADLERDSVPGVPSSDATAPVAPDTDRVGRGRRPTRRRS